MKLPFLKPSTKKVEAKATYAIGTYKPNIKEAIGTEPITADIKTKFPSELGVAHPFEMKIAEGIYTKFGFVTGAINKYVDYMVSKFYVTCENENTETIIEDWNKDVDFRTLLKPWVKEALVKGNGYLYLKDIKNPKLLDAKYIWIDRDEYGNIKGYNQYIGDATSYDKRKVIPLKKSDVAHLAFNKIGDCAYGLGLVFPTLPLINDFLMAQREMHTLMKRKANMPILIKLGYMSGDSMIVPDQAMVDSITSSLEYLNNKTEWVYSADMDVKALEFGNVGEKFSFILEHDAKMLFFSLEVPEVLMGSGNIAEGLGQAQSEMWKLNIASKQADVEKVIEQNIYKKILNDQGINEDVEFHWGEPSTTEKEKMITLLTSLIPLNLSPGLHVEIEKKLATMIGASEDSVETEEERQDRLMNTQLPQVPGQFGGRQMPNVPAASKGMGMRGMKEPEEEEEEDEEENYTGIVTEKDHSIKEWVGFNYEEYKKEIIDFLRQYSFDDLAATTAIELEMGYLTMTQIEDLRKILIEGFNTGQSIREIAKNIKNVVNPGALYSSADQGAKMLVNKDWRPIMIARTETVLAANMGSINNYKANGVEEYRWIASTGKRTCPQCQSLNGKIFTIGEGPIPAKDTHPNCRCTTGAVVRS